MSNKIRNSLLIAVVLVVLIQFIPIARTNPPVSGSLVAPQELMGILKRSCFDCHSNETVWPWYSRVAPISWLIAHDVKEGREHLNFSMWSNYSPEKQAKLRKEISEEVSEGEMPPLQYYPAHPDARLSQQDKDAVVSWARDLSISANKAMK